MSAPDPIKETTGRGTAAGVGAVLLWSTAASFITAAKGVNPFLYYGLEGLIGFLIFAVRWRLSGIDPRPGFATVPWWYLLAGIIGIGFQGAAWVAAVQNAEPLEALLFIYQWPMLVVILTALATGRGLQWQHVVAILLGFAGILIVLTGRGLDLHGFHLMPGHIYGLMAALFWSGYSALSARFPNISPHAFALILLSSGIVNMAIWLGVGAPPAPMPGLIICLAASFVIMPGYMLWDYGMKHGRVRLIGITSFLIPVLSSLLLIATGQATGSPLIAVALAVIMLGIGIARFGDSLPFFRKKA